MEDVEEDPRRIGRRELLVTVAVGVALAILATWPLVLRLDSTIPSDLIDPLIQTWQLAWGGHAVVSQPGDLWQANIFHPSPDSYAFTDSLLGLFPLGLLGSGAGAALVRYNVAFISAYALCFVAATLLARELGVRRPAAFVAGIGFAYAPWRGSQVGHLHIVFVAGIPLAAFLLLRGYRLRRPGLVFAGWAAALWQVAIGFGMGIYFGYAIGIAVVVTALRWLLAGRPSPPRPVVLATVAGMLLLAAGTLLLARPYLRVQDNYPQATRSRATLDFFSPPPKGLLVAAKGNRVWGGATEDARKSLPWAPEQTLFPGLAVVALGAAGLRRGPLGRASKVTLAATTVGATLLSFGTRGPGGDWTYGTLFEHAPGWQALRTPGRLTTFAVLALALLAAAGTQRLVVLAGRPAGRYAQQTLSPATLRRIAATVLAGVVLLEGAPRLDQPAVPKPPPGWERVTGPAMVLPSDFVQDSLYTYWSTEGFPRIANGNAAFLPPELADLRKKLEAFPDEASVAALRDAGISQVVVHTSRVLRTKYEPVLSRGVDGLPVTVESAGDLTIFTLQPIQAP